MVSHKADDLTFRSLILALVSLPLIGCLEPLRYGYDPKSVGKMTLNFEGTTSFQSIPVLTPYLSKKAHQNGDLTRNTKNN
jgi:hypothetical protein